MAIKVNNTTVIDNDTHALNVSKITFADASEQTSAAVGGSLGPVVIEGGTLLNTLDNPNAYGSSNLDWFGRSVAISGNYAIVGARQEDDPGFFEGPSSGKAYIFDVSTGSLLHTLDNPNAYSQPVGDLFGSSVAISGNYAVVGTFAEDDSGGTSSGKVYIFDVTTGSLVHTLDNPNAYSTSQSDYFGESVAISGNYVIVSAKLEDDAGGLDSGKVYIFDVSTGNLLHTLDDPNAYSTSQADTFGGSVAISGNYAIVGAYVEDDAGGSGSGKAYIFDVTTGTLLHTLDNPNAYSTSTNDSFGWSVAISGNYAIVSAYVEEDASGSNSGKAYIFDITTGNLLHTLDNPNPYSTSTDDYFGYSVGISGNYAIVGAYQEDDAGGTNSGAAYIFNVTTGELVYTLNNPTAYSISTYDNFGFSVAISGNYAIVGAYQEDDVGGGSSGKAYIFCASDIIEVPGVEEIQFASSDTITGSSLSIFDPSVVNSGGSLISTLDNPNAYSISDGDSFGDSVAISGNYAIVAGWTEDDAGGTFSGKAYIFNVTTGALLHTLDNPNPYSTSQNDWFGKSVAISGNYVIVGAYGEDDAGGTNSGKVYIYDVTTGTLVHTLDNPTAYSTSVNDYFGYSVAISGNYVIVGAYGEADAGGASSGKAYIFDVTTGSLVHTLDNPNAFSTSAGDQFGKSVAISGNYAIVGAFLEDDAGGANSGKAYIFDVSTGSFLHTLDNPNAYDTSFNDRYAESVSISGNYAIVSARQEDDAGGLDSGKAYIFDVTTGNLVHTLDNPNPYSTGFFDNFGTSVAISGNYAIVGAYVEDDAGGLDSGKAYIFDVAAGSLVHTLDNPTAYDTSAYDYFGNSVAISGNYVIVGARAEDDAGGLDSGKAYIFSAKDLTVADKLSTIADSL